MKSSGPSATRRTIQPFVVLATAALAASLSGCASPGPARPPSLHLPRLVTDLSAVRTGDSVALHWTTPEKTTDGLKVQPPLTAEICRQLAAHPAACAPVKSVPARPGPSEATDTLPGTLTTDPPALLTYRVKILNANGHSAGLSNPAFAAAGAAPPPVEHLHIAPVRNGAMIEWQSQSTPAFIDLDRTLVQTTAPKKRSGKQPGQLSAPSTPAEIHLQAGKKSADPGGTIDPIAKRGETYRYLAQRVRSITLGGHALEIRSTPSATITTLMRDTFPPATPSGLAAVPGTDSIDLSWEPNTEPDLAGYIVYRQTVATDGTLSAAPSQLTPTPIPAPAFSDLTAQPGQIYSYRVVAVDSVGNQSPASAEVRESRRNP
ncbi:MULTISPECIES: fibronectin type III domain-containing protein [Acidobacteriaceae]|uniref:fibronectin type III domain-containing protein n=1 Tax=Acidobacteriaceae TaxID=204434 RepID=UPI00131E6459|nr:MULTISPECIES: fibronectin type III domain-containing protein [Acidobacteriaceae]MDW5265807.1 fibronectin type III domain-containing protein [Edaphobacter sp.]